MDFEQTVKGLDETIENQIASECLNSMVKEEILFNEGFNRKADELTSLYELRLNIAKQNKTERKTEEEIAAWETAIKKMKQSNSQEFCLNWVHSESKLFILFWNPETIQLVSIFFLYTKKPLIEYENNYDDTIKKGYTVSSIKYYNRKKVKDWKK